MLGLLEKQFGAGFIGLQEHAITGFVVDVIF
jgi:hypothetical protein